MPDCYKCGKKATKIANSYRDISLFNSDYDIHNRNMCNKCYNYKYDYSKMYQPVWVDTGEQYSEGLYNMTHNECVTFINNMTAQTRVRLMVKQVGGRGDDIR